MAILGLNLSSQTAAYFLSSANTGLNKSISRLSSGSQFAIAGDKAGASAAAVVKQTAQRLGTVLEGVQAVSQVQATADSYLSSLQDTLNSLREIASKAQSAAYSLTERTAFDADYKALKDKALTMAANAQYSGTNILAGAVVTTPLGGASTFTSTATDGTGAINAAHGSVTTTAEATAAIAAVDAAQALLSTARAAAQSDITALSAISAGITTEMAGKENTLALLQDIDFAKESTALAKQNILVQSATAMLAQANSAQQNVLALLR